MNISGGQKQRIEIARALGKDADVLLLDEYVSSIEKSERVKDNDMWF